MDPAISMLDKALKGDSGSLLFLERVASIYVFDGSNPSKPMIESIWNFLNQALSEIERYETIKETRLDYTPLDAHLQLLATMSRKAARRSPKDDQKLVEVCLANAAQYCGSTEHALHLVHQNYQNRIRVMGRVAALVFDFTNHRITNQRVQSAISNPVAMDTLCALVAANTISSGPQEFSNLILEWLIPMIHNLPPFAVASVVYHLAVETLGEGAPSGSLETLKNKLFESCTSMILIPMLLESVGDNEVEGNRSISHRSAAMTLKAIERWCAAAGCNVLRLKMIGQSVNINIIAVISDAMYSDSEMVLDALAEMLETLMDKHTQDRITMDSLSMVQSFIQTQGIYPFESASTIRTLEENVSLEMSEREDILSELVIAIGLQRFKMKMHLLDEDSGICRCLARIARSIVQAMQQLLRSGKLQGSENGMIDLLKSAVLHQHLCVYSIAIDALKSILSKETASDLLILLQGKAVIPSTLIGLSEDPIDIDLHEFERFREYQLADTLNECYVYCRSFYIESCSTAIEEFSSTSPAPLLPYLLEAAIFCLNSVSIDATKRALLVTASPSAKIVAAKACNSQNPNASTMDLQTIGKDASTHDALLSRCIDTLCNVPDTASCNYLFLAQFSRMLGRYANWISKTPNTHVLDLAANLVIQLLNKIINDCGKCDELTESMEISPFSEITIALRNIISRAPNKFANKDALSVLEHGWRLAYTDNDYLDSKRIQLEDRTALCSGIIQIFVALPPENWDSSISSLALPTIECMESVSQVLARDCNLIHNQYILRIEDELCVLTCILRTFHYNTCKKVDGGRVTTILISLLHRIWPCIKHIAETLHHHRSIVSSLSGFLKVVVSLNNDVHNTHMLKEACGIANTLMNETRKENCPTEAISPILDFIEVTVDNFGHLAEHKIMSHSRQNDSLVRDEISQILQDIIKNSYEVFLMKESRFRSLDDAVPGIFCVLRVSLKRCPHLFLGLNRHAGEDIFTSSLHAAEFFINCKQADVIREAILFLCDTVTTDLISEVMKDKYSSIMAPIYSRVFIKLLIGSCGLFPREVLDPVGSLMYAILTHSSAHEAEVMCAYALQSEHLQLEESIKNTLLLVFEKCNRGLVKASKIMDLLNDIWILCQKVGIGGDAIQALTQKYS